MSGTRFTSAFAADLEGYLAFKQNMGCYGASRIWYLRQFDAWCAEGPTHHVALGVGHQLSRLRKVADLLALELAVVD